MPKPAAPAARHASMLSRRDAADRHQRRALGQHREQRLHDRGRGQLGREQLEPGGAGGQRAEGLGRRHHAGQADHAEPRGLGDHLGVEVRRRRSVRRRPHAPSRTCCASSTVPAPTSACGKRWRSSAMLSSGCGELSGTSSRRKPASTMRVADGGGLGRRQAAQDRDQRQLPHRGVRICRGRGHVCSVARVSGKRVQAGPGGFGAERALALMPAALQRQRVALGECGRADQHHLAGGVQRLRAQFLADQQAREIAGQLARRHAVEQRQRARAEGVVQQALAVVGLRHALQEGGLVERRRRRRACARGSSAGSAAHRTRPS